MDFKVKRLAADAGTFLSRAVQFTEEKLGQAEKTELDQHLENLLSRAECTKHWTEKILKQTEVLLQPNPRNALTKCGETEKQIGGAERELIQSSAINFLTPFRNFLEGDFKTIQKERKLLQVKRLDLDAAKTKLKKAKMPEARAAAHHLRCLNDLVEAQTTYYAQCYQYMVDLQKQLGRHVTFYKLHQTESLRFQRTVNSNGSRKARVLYDYDAAGSNELSLLADEVITVSSSPGMDSDWLMGERGNQRGKVPITYLELLN
ncbi:Endophilin-B1 [Bagarius yarrelli]|uniref:Endophilin-B1 n=1 Tax=Bagarius yarrelli TaxID=175774 RepID=A0A556VUE8_BAGYA|nr:Endophilin-B1 [Bagarius yarrelli]